MALNATIAGDEDQPFLAASTQKGLHATFHSPWSVAGGATWRGDRLVVHSTVEWFASVDPYEILSPDPAPIAGSASTIPLTFTGAANDVVNFGAGLEKRLGDRFTLYGGAARNASSWRPESETVATWDLIDTTVGLSLDHGGSRLAFGVGYAWGSEDLPRVISPPGSTEPPAPIAASFSRWTFSLGGSFRGH